MQSFLSQLLIREHEVIQEIGNRVTSQGSLWLSDPTHYENNIKQILHFLSNYADEFHHKKEEDILFPELRIKNESTGNAMVVELTEQHESFRETLQNIHRALEVKDYATVHSLFESYIGSLNDHIAVENDELFPMMDDIFSKDELERLYYRCIDLETTLGLLRKTELENLSKTFQVNETVK
jgi:hemerythrin-like domain-containing protein